MPLRIASSPTLLQNNLRASAKRREKASKKLKGYFEAVELAYQSRDRCELRPENRAARRVCVCVCVRMRL